MTERLGIVQQQCTSHGWTKLHSGGKLTGHAFAKGVKAYARWAGPAPDTTHAPRARWVSESTRSIIETHKYAATTRVYVQRVAVKKDRHSTSILDRLDV